MGSVVALQRSLFAAGVPAVDGWHALERVALTQGAWIDVARGWLRGADTLFDELVDAVPWRQGRRRMYDRVLDDPRLSHWYASGAPLPHPVLDDIARALAAHYGVQFGPVGFNYYRDGSDSVAFHADRELRTIDDTIVAVLTIGARRPFLVRPRSGGRSLDLSPASGDLLVMGGACQRHHEHGVPKVARAGPRISATWRWARRD
ncbi:MAG TPA: alpha-ketoglutarate-dependent dioxygenase AlkB [Acidimicrobiia bacterium]|nr:alpha-ketoglutarate-dependent dioxygenase AlkB [Acidimicrobiia bacterium]